MPRHCTLLQATAAVSTALQPAHLPGRASARGSPPPRQHSRCRWHRCCPWAGPPARRWCGPAGPVPAPGPCCCQSTRAGGRRPPTAGPHPGGRGGKPGRRWAHNSNGPRAVWVGRSTHPLGCAAVVRCLPCPPSPRSRPRRTCSRSSGPQAGARGASTGGVAPLPAPRKGASGRACCAAKPSAQCRPAASGDCGSAGMPQLLMGTKPAGGGASCCCLPQSEAPAEKGARRPRGERGDVHALQGCVWGPREWIQS